MWGPEDGVFATVVQLPTHSGTSIRARIFARSSPPVHPARYHTNPARPAAGAGGLEINILHVQKFVFVSAIAETVPVRQMRIHLRRRYPLRRLVV